MIDFDNFCTVSNKNEHYTKQVQTVSLQPDFVFSLPGKTKNNTKTADFAFLDNAKYGPIKVKFGTTRCSPHT